MLRALNIDANLPALDLPAAAAAAAANLGPATVQQLAAIVGDGSAPLDPSAFFQILNQAAPTTLQVVIPPGVFNGQYFQVANPAGGGMVQVQVPMGVGPGATIQLQAPAPQVRLRACRPPTRASQPTRHTYSCPLASPRLSLPAVPACATVWGVPVLQCPAGHCRASSAGCHPRDPHGPPRPSRRRRPLSLHAG